MPHKGCFFCLFVRGFFAFHHPYPLYPTKVVTCGRRDAALVSFLFFATLLFFFLTVIPHSGGQVLHEGQLTVNHLICLFGKQRAAVLRVRVCVCTLGRSRL